jgi:hypothetical protein
MIKSISKSQLARRLNYATFDRRRTEAKFNRIKAEEAKIKQKLLMINQWPEEIFVVYEELWTSREIRAPRPRTPLEGVEGSFRDYFAPDYDVVGIMRYPRYAMAAAIKLPVNPKRDPTDWEIRDFLSTARYYDANTNGVLEKAEVEVPWSFTGEPTNALGMIRPIEMEYLSYIEKYRPYKCIRLKDRGNGC